jgi:hypothetical protein
VNSADDYCLSVRAFQPHAIARSREVNRAVVVAVIAVRMVQVAVDEIVDVIPMRHRFMAAPRSVNVARIVAAAARRALVRIFGAHFEPVLVYMIGVRMMQMTIMQIINVIVVLDCSMSTVGAMLMVVVSVMWFVAGAHEEAPWLKRSRQLGRPNAQRVDRSDSMTPYSEDLAAPIVQLLTSIP